MKVRLFAFGGKHGNNNIFSRCLREGGNKNNALPREAVPAAVAVLMLRTVNCGMLMSSIP